MYTRKTIDQWEVQVDYGYGNGFETVYTATSLSEAKTRKADYIRHDSFAKDVKIVYHRIRRIYEPKNA